MVKVKIMWDVNRVYRCSGFTRDGSDCWWTVISNLHHFDPQNTAAVTNHRIFSCSATEICAPTRALFLISSISGVSIKDHKATLSCHDIPRKATQMHWAYRLQVHQCSDRVPHLDDIGNKDMKRTWSTCMQERILEAKESPPVSSLTRFNRNGVTAFPWTFFSLQ